MSQLKEIALTESTSFSDSVGATRDRVRGDRLAGVIRFFLLLVVSVVPLMFGGVHQGIYLVLESATFLFVALVICFRFDSLCLAFSSKVSRLTLFALLGFAAITTLGLVLSTLGSNPHPVLTEVAAVSLSYTFLASIRAVLFAISFFVLVKWMLHASPGNPTRVINWVVLASFFVSLTAISHWFYDNGLLFWVFEPNYVFTSNRARWPFVNANHLGHFMVLCIFPLLALIERLVFGLRDKIHSGKVAKLSDFVSERRNQSAGLAIVLSIALLVCCVVALLGSQSRGAWFGTGVCLALYLLGSAAILRSLRVDSSSEIGGDSSERTRLRRGSEERGRRRKRTPDSAGNGVLALQRLFSLVRKSYRPILGIAAVLVISFFLNEKGRELVEGRIEYGLLYTKDDIRWNMYEDSWPMFLSSPVLGVGLGMWESKFPKFVSVKLADLDPGYMHSDPLQLLVEVGVLGVLPLVLLGLGLLIVSLRVIFTPSDHSLVPIRLKLLGGVSALLGLVIASSFDFPFRIPAILCLFLVLVALQVRNVERIAERITERVES